MMFGIALLLAALLLAIGCGSVPNRLPQPEIPRETNEMPRVLGMTNPVRYWGDTLPGEEYRKLKRVSAMSDKELRAYAPTMYSRQLNFLAISGGGSKGAFGAGLLAGWSTAGNRPEFQIVTGVSTGALTAPFAFLGPDYDRQLKEIYTQLSTEDLVGLRFPLEILGGAAALDVTGLKRQIAKHVNEDVLAEIASQHRRGRRLLIGTTNLDAARPVIWDIGRIAGSRHPDALGLIRKVMLASASIPAAFPPVIIDVEHEGRRFDELHVDGGVTSQVFVYPADLDVDSYFELVNAHGTPSLYVIRNATLLLKAEQVKPGLIPVAGRSIASLTRTQGMGDLNLMYQISQRDGLDYNLALIPISFDLESEEIFDPTYMTALYDLGYEMAKNGYPWEKYPPWIRKRDRAAED